MRKNLLRNLLVCSGLAVVLLQSCKDDSNLTVPVPPSDASFTESFDNFSEALSKGWYTFNKSSPAGPIMYDVAELPDFGSPNYVCKYYPQWEQAQLTLDPAQFPNAPYPNRIWQDAFFSQRGTNGYAATSAANTIPWQSGHDISSWLVSPQVTIKNGDKISFYTFSKGLSRLQLWVNPTGNLNVGSGVDNTGDFNMKLVDINTAYDKYETNPAKAYPTEWTKFEGTVSGLSAPVKGRFAFRYYLAGQPGFTFDQNDPNNLDTIFNQVHRSVTGLDEVTFTSAK